MDRDRRTEAPIIICASDPLFADHSVDRKSLYGYIIKLFGGLLAWRVNIGYGTDVEHRSRVVSPIIDSKGSYLISRLLKVITLRLMSPTY